LHQLMRVVSVRASVRKCVHM